MFIFDLVCLTYPLSYVLFIIGFMACYHYHHHTFLLLISPDIVHASLRAADMSDR